MERGPGALVGSGEFLPVMEDVDRGLIEGRPRVVAVLPTAAAPEGDAVVGRCFDLALHHYARLDITMREVPVLTRDDAERDDLTALLRGAGLIYLSGGNPGYLADTLRDTAMASAIVQAWEGGAALAGCSA